MLLSPVIERELRLALRKRGMVQSRFRHAALGVGLVALFLLFGWASGTRYWGRSLHTYLFYGGLYLSVLPAAQISVGLFTEDRRNQTLELLYLSGMNPAELFFGKLLGGILAASCDLLALLPLLAIPFFSGGISLDVYLATIACLPTLLLFTVAVGGLASILCTDEAAALVLTMILIGFLSLGLAVPYHLGEQFTGKPPFSAAWLCVSPAYGPYLVHTHFTTTQAAAFWTSTVATAGWTIFCLTLTAILLQQTWRREISRAPVTGWRETRRAWIRGSTEWRQALRQSRLTPYPFQWLAQQDRRPVLIAWAAIGGLCLIWLLGWFAWPHLWPSTVNFFTTAILLLVLLELLMIHAAARRIGDDRRDGALELLLTTSLRPWEIVEGQLEALTAQFRPVRRAVLALGVLMMLAGFLTRTWNVRGVISYLIIWALLFGWCFRPLNRTVPRAMWIALNTGRPIMAIFRTTGIRWTSYWMLFNLYNVGRSLLSLGSHAPLFPTGSIPELVFVIFVAVIILAIAAGAQPDDTLRQRLLNDMRAVAQEPVPAHNDPRFKEWKDVNRRLSSVPFPKAPRPPQREPQFIRPS